MIARRTLLALPPTLLLAGAAGAGRDGALHWDSSYLFLRVRVNGRPADALLDLNAGTTQVDREHAARLGITGTGARPIIEAAGRRLGHSR
jgi:predicted aspartyl protease